MVVPGTALVGGRATDAVALAPVLGNGLTQDRSSRPPITRPHGFGLEWLRLAPGAATGLHRHRDTQVVVLVDGDWEIAVNPEPDRVATEPATGSLISIPADVWRGLRNVGSTEARAVIVTGGDGPSLVEWPLALVEQAASAGFGLDAAGYVAPLELLGRPS